MSKGNPSAAPSGSRAPADAALAAPVDVDASTKSGYGGYGARGQAQSSEGGAAGPSQAPPAVRKPLSAVLSREWVRSFVEDFGRLKSAAGGHDDPAGSAGGQLGIHTRRDAARLAQSIYGGQVMVRPASTSDVDCWFLSCLLDQHDIAVLFMAGI